MHLSYYIRLETHLMMSLCHGKVSVDTARLALSRQVIKVRFCLSFTLSVKQLLFHFALVSSQWKILLKVVLHIIVLLLTL